VVLRPVFLDFGEIRTMKVIFPPRPKSKIHPNDLPYYDSQGKWVVQRKFNGTRNVIHITPEGELSVYSRYGKAHSPSKFVLQKGFRDEIMSSLNLEKGKEYWLDSELMNKQVDSGKEIILYDVLQAGRYLFGSPNQMERLELLKHICGDPQNLEPGGIALQISPRLWMAQTWADHFVDRFKEALPNPKLEGLVLRRKDSAIDNFGDKEYETTNVIRCRKPFAAEKGPGYVAAYDF
jgi:ATP-dependent DNA ligase